MFFSIKKGALLPIMGLSTTLDLTGSSGLGIKWRPFGGGAKVIGTGTLQLLTSGLSGSTLTYAFASGETEIVGVFEVELFSTISGKPVTVPVKGFGLFRVSATIE